ncbi:N-acyl homoserine lactonase family protein [Nocardia sp. NBC_00881]|uniref:N-acyl homoserine lactonase family protein n=1 Tax=Nocardia sp. NBC_00881 TaxID=2975995 RepID=UPI00386661FA|nr:N-acyl homoserine lactonase family protein [Nocardia sp. NBC_00881]
MSVEAGSDWEVWAIRLGSVDRLARDNFLSPGDRTGTMRLDFTMWVARRGAEIVVVDTGFATDAGRRRGRVLDTAPAEAVRRLGIRPENVATVVLTHLHYDHAGNVGDFPNARVLVQHQEMAYVTGPRMRHPRLSHFFEPGDIVDVVERIHNGGVEVLDGDVILADGLELYLIGGHTQGLQVVRIRTVRGWIVLASDALHYYDNFRERNPFPAILDLGLMLDGYDRLVELADSEDHIVPGHDPEVFARYREEPVCGGGDIVALHLPSQSG